MFELIHWPGGQERFDNAERGYSPIGSHGNQNVPLMGTVVTLAAFRLRTQ